MATSLAAQGAAPKGDAKEMLAEARNKLMQAVNRLPRYLCAETIDRSTFQPETAVLGSCKDVVTRKNQTDWGNRKEQSDRLRLDVAVSVETEMYSWAGKDRFDDRTLGDLVRGGATSTGEFSSWLRSIFGTSAAIFTYRGNVSVDGRSLLEFDYRVPQDQSHYRVSEEKKNALVPYEGSFLLDPHSLDLIRLTVLANQIPAELKTCELVTTLDYGSVRLNDSEFLLPKDVTLHVVYSDGTEMENRTVFSGCHEFVGKSSLRVDAASDSEPQADRTAAKTLPLPTGRPFKITLTGRIDTSTAAAGDAFQAKLAYAIIGSHQEVLVPKGAAVSGRIVELKRIYGKGADSLILALKLETIEIHGVLQKFDASLGSRSLATPGVYHNSFTEIADPNDPAVGFLTFHDVKGSYVIHRGVQVAGLTSSH